MVQVTVPDMNGPSRRIPTDLSSPANVLEVDGVTIYSLFPMPYSITQHGGPVVGSADLQLLFWGDFWNKAANPSVSDIVQAVGSILDSPYLSELEQYGFHSLTLRSPLVVTQPGPPGPSYTADDVTNMVWDLIDNNIFPEPDEDGGRIIYIAFGPHGTFYKDSVSSEGEGAHTGASDIDVFDVDFAWVGWVNHGVADGNGHEIDVSSDDTLDFITSVFSHELVETISDPEPNSGWRINGLPNEVSEIADFPALFDLRWMVGGYSVEPYYSARLGSFVVPGYPIQRTLRLTGHNDSVGGEEFISEGESTVDHKTKCFKGTYHWRLFGQASRCTVNAQVDSYVKPEVTWMVNGQRAFSFLTTLTVPANLSDDALAQLVSLPTEEATISCHVDNSGSLVVEAAIGQPPTELQIECQVDEKALPFDVLHLKRSAQKRVFITGRFRQMDDQYGTDLNKCVESALRAASLKLTDQGLGKNKGDPVPPWVDHDLGFLSNDVRQPIREASFLGHLFAERDVELAGQLRDVASAKLAEARNAKIDIVKVVN